MQNTNILITGSTSGIGKYATLYLAEAGADIVVTYRSKAKAAALLNEFSPNKNNGSIKPMECNLSSIDNVREFCNEYKKRHHKLDILINNAGIWNTKRKLTKDNIEETFQVNFLSHFLITHELKQLIEKSEIKKIIFTSSALHSGTIRFDDIEFKKSFSGFKSYKQSKLAIILLTRFLSEKYKDLGIEVNCFHPGIVNTELARNSNIMSKLIFQSFGKSTKKGADTLIYLASKKDLGVTGEYFANRKVKRTTNAAYNPEAAKKLYNIAMEYLRIVS